MSLYLAVFANDEELCSVEIGKYADFNYLRETVCRKLEDGQYASQFPILQNHPDSDGEWSQHEVSSLRREFAKIRSEFQKLPPVALPDGWKVEVATSLGLKMDSLNDCFFDVDGEPLLTRLIELCDFSFENQLPILFQ